MPYLASIHEIINFAGLALDVVGVLIIVIGAVLSTLAFLTPWRAHPLTYRGYRKNVGLRGMTRLDSARQ